MAHAIFHGFTLRASATILAGGILGASLGFASAQETGAGWLNPECARTCAANGYDGEFCQSVCWVPDPALVAETENIDWKCFEACGQRGGKTRACLASCRR